MEEHLKDLKEIRTLMEKSSKFLSLSGLSGVAAGSVAILASGWAYFEKVSILNELENPEIPYSKFISPEYVQFLIQLGIGTLFLAIALGVFFTWRKAKGNLLSLWNPVSKKLFVGMVIPLFAGGCLIIALLINKVYWVIPELTLIFYGLALINASQYTVRDVFYLGLSEILLGIVALFVSGYSLWFWAVGFGLLHIIYGISMHYKYDNSK